MNRHAAYLIALVATMLLLAAPAQAAGPQFHLLIDHAPDQKQGDGHSFYGGEPATYTLTVTNIGDAATSAPIVLTDTLGAGLTFSAVDPGPSFSCSGDASLATPLTCTRAAPLGAGQSDSIQLSVAVVEVATDETVTSSTTATVSGGVCRRRLEELRGALCSRATRSNTSSPAPPPTPPKRPRTPPPAATRFRPSTASSSPIGE